MKPFRERNLTRIGWVGFAVIAALVFTSFRADAVPFIGGGDDFVAEFAEVGTLKPGAEVRIAGVSVGTVRDITLDGDHVDVQFRLDRGTEIGSQSRAEIRIRTLLGAQFLAIVPRGDDRLEEDSTIPLNRTRAPYDVVEAFEDLSETTTALDTDQIAAALDTLSVVAEETPEEFRDALEGVSAVSRNLAARDEQINTLLVNLKKVTGVLNSRDDELVRLFTDADVLFSAVAARRDSIHQLLETTQALSAELSAVVEGTRADLNPALTQLETVTTMLVKHQSSLDHALELMPGFTRVYANALGSGPWFDAYLANVPPNLGVTNQLKSALGGE